MIVINDYIHYRHYCFIKLKTHQLQDFVNLSSLNAINNICNTVLVQSFLIILNEGLQLTNLHLFIQYPIYLPCRLVI